MVRSFIYLHLKTIIVIFFAFMMLILWHRHLIFMDETDNMLGALSVARGEDIYNGFFSQHTPFVYYYFSVFAFFGVREYETFRLCMSFTLLLFWLIIFFLYRKKFGENVILVTIALYALTLGLHWGHMILSDVFQGYSLFVLLLELINYWETKQCRLRNHIIISSCVFISTMSAFVSVYPVFIIFIGFVIHELIHNKRIAVYKSKMRSYFSLVGIALIPFFLLVTWYALTNNLSNFYFQAYEFNRTYYSKYLSGFGSNGLIVFKDTFVGWINFVTTSVTKFSFDTLLSTLFVLFILIFLRDMFRKNKALAAIIFVFIAFTGMRGYTGAHGVPFYIIAFFCSGYVINKYLIRKEVVLAEYKKVVLQCMTFFLILSSINNYIPHAGDNFYASKGVMASDSLDRYIQTLTTEKDRIWLSNPVSQYYIKNHREPASRVYGLVPWFADAYSDIVIDDLSKNKPKLIVFVKEELIWNYKFEDFAADIFIFIKKNYKILDPDDPTGKNVYILNEYYDEAFVKLWGNIDKYGLSNGMIVTDSKSNVYLIENDSKRYIPNGEIFAKYNLNWANLKTVNDGVLPKIKIGDPLS